MHMTVELHRDSESEIRMRLSIFLMAVLLINCSLAYAQGSNPELIAQAKKEGRVTWYTTVSIPESKQFMDMFEKQYPFIKVDLLRSGSGPLVNRIVSEYAARNYAADVLHGMSSRGGFTVLKQRNIIGRYESPERKYYPAELKIRKVTGRLLFKIHLCWLITNET